MLEQKASVENQGAREDGGLDGRGALLVGKSLEKEASRPLGDEGLPSKLRCVGRMGLRRAKPGGKQATREDRKALAEGLGLGLGSAKHPGWVSGGVRSEGSWRAS